MQQYAYAIVSCSSHRVPVASSSFDSLFLYVMTSFVSIHAIFVSEDDGIASPPPHLRSLAEREHLRAMEAAHHVMEEAKKRMEEVHRSSAPPLIPPPIIPFSKQVLSVQCQLFRCNACTRHLVWCQS